MSEFHTAPPEPAAALRHLTDRLTEAASPTEAAQIVQQVVDPEMGLLAALTELTASATDWARARLTFDNPHSNPGFELWKRLNGCTSMLVEIGQELRTAPAEIAGSPQAPVDPRHHDFVRRRRNENPGRQAALHNSGLPVQSTPDAIDTGADFHDAETDRQRAALATSPHATARTTGSAAPHHAEPLLTAPTHRPRAR